MSETKVSVVADRKSLEALLREASSVAEHKGAVELPTTVALAFARLIAEASESERLERLRGERLFEGRVPEAAARQTATVLAWSAEESLKLLDGMRGRKSTPKGALARFESTCETLVRQCQDLGVEARGLRGVRCERLEAAMAKLAK